MAYIYMYLQISQMSLTDSGLGNTHLVWYMQSEQRCLVISERRQRHITYRHIILYVYSSTYACTNVHVPCAWTQWLNHTNKYVLYAYKPWSFFSDSQKLKVWCDGLGLSKHVRATPQSVRLAVTNFAWKKRRTILHCVTFDMVCFSTCIYIQTLLLNYSCFMLWTYIHVYLCCISWVISKF